MEITSTKMGRLWWRTWTSQKIRDHAVQFSVGRPCHTSSESMGLSGCTPVICLVIRHHTAVFGCQKKWQFIFFTKPQSVPLWQFTKDRRRVMGPIHLSVTHTYPSLRLSSAETDLHCLTFPSQPAHFGRSNLHKCSRRESGLFE